MVILLSLDPNKLASIAMKHNTFATVAGDKQMLHYKSGVYLPNGDDVMAADIENEMQGEMVNNHLITEISGHIRRRTSVNREDFDSNPRIINMANGLYNIDTGISPHRKNYLSLHKSPIAYDPKATCPNIDKFFNEVAPGFVQTIYEMIAYGLSPDKNLKTMFILVGGKNSGKSVAIQVIESMFDKSAITHVTPQTVSTSPFGAAQYYGKQLNTVDDLGNSPIRDTGTLKSLVVNRAEIDAQFKYGQTFQLVPNAVIIMAANDLPKIEPFDDALASRIMLIEFPKLFEGDNADPNIIDKLATPEQLSGLFNKVMDALIDLEENKAFSNSISLDDRVKAYRQCATPMERFLEEVCVFDDPDVCISKETLFNQYTHWANRNNTMVEGVGQLTTILKNMGCIITRPGTGNDRPRLYKGVRFNTELGDF